MLVNLLAKFDVSIFNRSRNMVGSRRNQPHQVWWWSV